MDVEKQKSGFEDFDRWLDIALRQRVTAEPRSGLEERVLARLAAQPTQRFGWWPVWATAAGIFVIAIILALMYPYRQERITNGQHPAAGSSGSGTQAAQSIFSQSRDTTASSVRKRMLAKTAPRLAAAQRPNLPEPERLPKLATFPAPRPETTQERLLARLAAQPNVVKVAIVSDDGMPLKELSIPELKIDPIEGTPPDNVRRDELGRKDALQERK